MLIRHSKHAVMMVREINGKYGKVNDMRIGPNDELGEGVREGVELGKFDKHVE